MQNTQSRQTYYQDRLREVIERERREKGLVGIRICVRESDDTGMESVARDVLSLHDAVLAGRAVDISGQDF